MFRQTLLIAVASTLSLASAALSIAGDLGRERVFYEIVVTNQGTKSQGWNGKLFQPDGAPLPMKPGQSVETNIGTFVPVPCGAPHEPCGFIEQRMKAELTNTIMAPAWIYRLHVAAECYKSEEFRGELLRGGKSFPGSSSGTTIETPMGPFEWRSNPYEHGWFHKSWPHHMMLPEGWPCAH